MQKETAPTVQLGRKASALITEGKNYPQNEKKNKIYDLKSQLLSLECWRLLLKPRSLSGRYHI
jgi:hypothetical protein